MTCQLRVLMLAGLTAFAFLPDGRGYAAGGPTSRGLLDQAAIAAQSIQLAGDQSAARRDIAQALAEQDPQAAIEMTAGIRRPSDAARALSAVAVGLYRADPTKAKQSADTASRLLLRISEPARRDQEQRLLIEELAPLGADAVPPTSEISGMEAHVIAVIGRARTDPAAALALLKAWKLSGPVADPAYAAIAVGFSGSDADQAVKAATEIGADGLRERTLWRIAEGLPPLDAYGVAQRVTDPVVRSGILASAAARLAAGNPEAATTTVQEVAVAAESAKAELAVALATADLERALGIARGLSERPRKWALERIAVSVAGAKPEEVEKLLTEAAAGPEAIGEAAAAMAAANPTRTAEFGRGLPVGEARDAALAAAAPALARTDAKQASDLLWEIDGVAERTRAVEAVALQLAGSDLDAATSLIGLVPDATRALRLRARVAANAAVKAPEAATRLLATLPESDYRTDAALEAASAVVMAGGDPQVALKLGRTALEQDLALRWMLPSVAASQTASPINLSDSISDGYLKSLALLDAAKRLGRAETKARQAPGRARMVRPVAEWEGM